MSGAHLTVQNLTTGYHGFQVLQDLTLEAAPGITVIVGPNGAGKTTLLKALAGLLPRQGTVTLDGQAVPAMNATACVQRGLALVAEGRQLFPQMTVAENLAINMEKRISLFLNNSAEERYRFLLKNNSLLVQSVPLQYLAAYIGITPQHMSRLRKK